MLLDLNELVLARAQADLLGMRDARAPVGVGMRDAEGILGLLALQMLVVMLHLGRAIGELGVGQRLGCHDGIGAGLIDSDRVEAREHADVVDDRRIVFGMAIAVGADIHGERDMEARAAVDTGLRILGDLTVEHVGRGRIAGRDCVLVAHADAAAAAHAAIVVDGSHVDRAGVAVGKLALAGVVERDGAVRADLLAGTAANAVLGRDFRLAGGMLPRSLLLAFCSSPPFPVSVFSLSPVPQTQGR